ncbi:predicted protein [Naegleria gruberi]|uniref:Predicted protein n=1 Tax=Naegleria gruberi TaxID=5762 RepID=D2W5E9_NAEGR|nr:uncharacterized protein NAEGRDRAFT_76641 [Naegleria gruberi]EFC35703.1 predicted protein [Naegleria gruberi]|eukprot:XP_002668447.1 predicted protein [Naegleria gruberi strain NEG-M]
MRKSVMFFGSKLNRNEADEQYLPYTNHRHSKMFGTITSSTVNNQNNSLNFTLPRIINIDMKDPLKCFEFINNCEKGAFNVHAIEFSHVQYLLQQLVCSNSIYSELPIFHIKKQDRVSLDLSVSVSPSTPISTSRRETVSGSGGYLTPNSPNFDDNSSSSSLGSTFTNPSIPNKDLPSISTGLNERKVSGFGKLKKIFQKVSPSTPSSPKKKRAKVLKNLFDSMPNLTKLTMTESFANEMEADSFEGYSFGHLCEYLTSSAVTSLTGLTSVKFLLNADFPKLEEIHLQDAKDGSIHANTIERQPLVELYTSHKSKVILK